MNVDKYYELRMASVFKGLNVKIDAVSVWIGGYIMRIQAANTFYTCLLYTSDAADEL